MCVHALLWHIVYQIVLHATSLPRAGGKPGSSLAGKKHIWLCEMNTAEGTRAQQRGHRTVSKQISVLPHQVWAHCALKLRMRKNDSRDVKRLLVWYADSSVTTEA